MRLPYLVSLLALSSMGATNCGGDAIKDTGFDLWCGDSLCAWKLERGTLEQVPTWHEGDSGVSLTADDTAIEQLSQFNSGDGTCLEFDFVANVTDDAEVYFNVDLEGDGTLEMHERIPTSHWAPVSYAFSMVSPYDGIRFEIAKKGGGTVVLAQLGARRSDKCNGGTPLDPGPRKNGATCFANSDCASALCEGGDPRGFPGVCAGCDGTHGCTGGEVCGVVDPIAPIYSPTPVACEAAKTRELGEACISDAECASDICQTRGQAFGVCSSCEGSCAGGASQCRAAWTDNGFRLGPDTCSMGKSGDACAADGDCTSGHCNGSVRMECGDGRSCATRDDCPVESDLTPGECTTVGVQGGSCQ